MILTALIIASFVLALVFPVAYSFSRWSKYAPGRALMFFSVICAAVTGLGAWRAVFGEFAASWVRIAVYLSIALGLAVMDYVLLKEQARDRRSIRGEQEKVDH